MELDGHLAELLATDGALGSPAVVVRLIVAAACLGLGRLVVHGGTGGSSRGVAAAASLVVGGVITGKLQREEGGNALQYQDVSDEFYNRGTT